MITHRQVRRLWDIQQEAPEVTTLYLDADRGFSGSPARLRHTWEALRGRRWSDLSKNGLKEEVLRSVQSDFDRISAYLQDLNGSTPAGLALFGCSRTGLWEIWPLPEAPGNLLVVDRKPYIKPMTLILGEARRFGVVVADGKTSRCFETYLGEIEELRSSGPEDSSGADARFRPTRAPLHEHLARSAAQAWEAWNSRGWERVILACPPELQEPFLRHLHTTLQDNLILDPSLSLGSGQQEVLEKVRIGEREARKVRESVLVHRLLDQAKGGSWGVVGLERTLDCLQSGRVRMLLYRDGFTRMGRICTRCGHLSFEGKRCVACYLPTEPLFDIVGEMVRIALEMDCEVFRILHSNALDPYGKIGAELRFEGPEPSAPHESKDQAARGQPARARLPVPHTDSGLRPLEAPRGSAVAHPAE